MIKYIYVLDTKKADELSELGFKYSKSKINGQNVSVFEIKPDMMDTVFGKFSEEDFIILDKLIF